MISNNSQLLAAGRADLKGRWAEAAMLTFVMCIISFSGSAIGGVIDTLVYGPQAVSASTNFNLYNLMSALSSGVFSTLMSLLLIPVGWSFTMTFLAHHRHESDDPFGVGNLFTGYRHFWKVLGVVLLQVVLVYLCIIPFGLIAFLMMKFMLLIDPWVLLGVAIILFICIGAWVGIRLSMMPFILRDNPQMRIMDIMHQSVRMMDGHKMQFLRLSLFYLALILLCIPTLCIGLLWAIPYIEQTTVNFYEQVRAEYDGQKQAA